MTSGQKRAVKELERLHSVNPDGFQIMESPKIVDGLLKVTISIRLGLMETKSGGLNFREREEFILTVPPDFPFEYPRIDVDHTRFAAFPHVNWSRHICLFQSKIEWNPADGLYGFFERFSLWLGRAAKGDMDPVEGPLHPPVHTIDWSQCPFVIRKDSPVKANESWYGLAELEKHSNRIELVGWNDLSGDWPEKCYPALAIVLPNDLPPEFPSNGKDFFAELSKQGMDKERILGCLTLAAKLTPENETAYLILGIPMRRSPNGETKHHIAVWAIDPKGVENLKSAALSKGDTQEVKQRKERINKLIYEIFESIPIKWCPVLEDRNEIIVRRDSKTSVAWFTGKKVLILGCGALGSWNAEVIARASPSCVHLVDNSIVKPGLLTRQNYSLDDIGSYKAFALMKRIKSIAHGMTVENFNREAHSFIIQDLNRFKSYDLVLDCTASHIFQMKLERDWIKFDGRTPRMISMVIDAKAKHCLSVHLPQNFLGGIWGSFIQLKQRLCFEGNKEVVTSFYSELATKDLFQPEPGCSDPTFSGSAADIASLTSTMLNLSVQHSEPAGIAFSVEGGLKTLKLSDFQETIIGDYRVRIYKNVYKEASAWVKQNNRIRSSRYETGGLLWGLWDDAVGVIWVFDVSGPPPDSIHDPGQFVCGVEGTIEEHKRRFAQSQGTSGFIGFWHTHPNMLSRQSLTDIGGMVNLVSQLGENQKRATMLIFGRAGTQPSAGIYIYESTSVDKSFELLSVGESQIILETKVV